MKYKLCQGVTLVTVCDENMLIATREARDKVGYIKVINDTGAYLWRLLEKDIAVDEIVQMVCVDYQDTEERVRPIVFNFLESLHKLGYIELDGVVE